MGAIIIAFLFCLFLGATFPTVEAAIAGIDDAIMATVTVTSTSTDTGLAVSPGRRWDPIYIDWPTHTPGLNSSDTDSGHASPTDIWVAVIVTTVLLLMIIGAFSCVLRPDIRPNYNWRHVAGLRNALHNRRRGPAAEAEPGVGLDRLEGEVPTVPPPAYVARV
ncbi:hypothetical protein N7540_012294 [Penicillium herquei]|nr:hypothetical protein N7540_012294 [Penicillium herquei]